MRDPTSIRWEDALYDKVKAAADEDGVTFTKEVFELVKLGLDERDVQNALKEARKKARVDAEYQREIQKIS